MGAVVKKAVSRFPASVGGKHDALTVTTRISAWGNSWGMHWGTSWITHVGTQTAYPLMFVVGKPKVNNPAAYSRIAPTDVLVFLEENWVDETADPIVDENGENIVFYSDQTNRPIFYVTQKPKTRFVSEAR